MFGDYMNTNHKQQKTANRTDNKPLLMLFVLPSRKYKPKKKIDKMRRNIYTSPTLREDKGGEN